MAGINPNLEPPTEALPPGAGKQIPPYNPYIAPDGSNIDPGPEVEIFVAPEGAIVYPNVTPSPDLLSAAQKSGKYYTRYLLQTFYNRHEGKMQVPVGGPVGTVVSASIIDLFAPVGRKMVVWLAQRFGAWPVLPGWQTGSPNETLACREIVATSPPLSMNGNDAMYQVEGFYIYYLGQPLEDEDYIPTGTTPLTTRTSEQTLMPPAVFDQTLLQFAFGPGQPNRKPPGGLIPAGPP